MRKISEEAPMLIISADDLRQAVPMSAAMEAVASAFAQLSNQQADVPLRPHVAVPPAEGLFLVMPAYLAGSGALGVKALTLFPQNPQRYQLPSINALVLLFDTDNGQPLALMDGGWLTALRTGAASGVATRLLARQDARTLALFGAGGQALPQAWAVCVARPIERIWLVNRTPAHAEHLAEQLRTFGPPIPADVRVASSAAEALREADIICCATASPTPLFEDADLRPGAHINGVGSYRPTLQEVPAATVARARVVVDQRRAAWAEAGDLVIPREQGVIDETHIAGELGEVVAGRVAGRTDDAQITFFKSVGNAAQDIAVAQLAVQRARALGLGTEANL
jgi:ornithine cyclodeaminase/alanine dehydrogenase-like protein (mu-crystallin family)